MPKRQAPSRWFSSPQNVQYLKFIESWYAADFRSNLLCVAWTGRLARLSSPRRAGPSPPGKKRGRGSPPGVLERLCRGVLRTNCLRTSHGACTGAAGGNHNFLHTSNGHYCLPYICWLRLRLKLRENFNQHQYGNIQYIRWLYMQLDGGSIRYLGIAFC